MERCLEQARLRPKRWVSLRLLEIGLAFVEILAGRLLELHSCHELIVALLAVLATMEYRWQQNYYSRPRVGT